MKGVLGLEISEVNGWRRDGIEAVMRGRKRFRKAHGLPLHLPGG